MRQPIAIRLSISNAERSRCALQNARRSDSAGPLRTTVPRRRENSRGPDGSGRGLATGRLKTSRGPETGRAGARPPRRPPDALSRAARRLGPADRLDKPNGRLLAKPVRPTRTSTQKDGPMSKPATETLSVTAKRTSKNSAKSGAKEGKGGDSPSQLIDARIKELSDWRGETLARVRILIKQADPEVVEEWKWRGVPVWSHAGMICTGETYKSVVKMTFAKGASLEDPSGLFNSSLEGNVRRAIDWREGDEIDEAALKELIGAAVTLNTSMRATARPVRSQKRPKSA